jgi:hypothetical protein
MVSPVSIMGMGIERMHRGPDHIEVLTTAARSVLNAEGTLECWQRIPRSRRTLTVRFPEAMFPVAVTAEVTTKQTWMWLEDDGYTCTISGRRATLQISGECLVVLRIDDDAAVDIQGHFEPRFHTRGEDRQETVNSRP